MYDDYEEVDVAAANAKRAAWVTDKDLAALGLERATGVKTADGGPETHLQQAERVLREAAPLAAAQLVNLARFGESEQIRLKASTEILNRAAAQGGGNDGREPWAEVYESVLSTESVERFANGGRS
jgi:hypothetical protein